MRKPTNSIQAQMKTNLVHTLSGAASTGALVTATTAYNIKDGEVAMLQSDLDAANYGHILTSPAGKVVKLIQGTPKSAVSQTVDAWGISDPAFVETTEILKDGVRAITTSNYNSGSYAMSLFTDAPTITVNGEYGLLVELDGRRQEREFGRNTDTIVSSFIAPSTLPTSGEDLVLQNLASKLNSQSQLLGATKRFVVLGLSVAGTGGGTALSALINDNGSTNFTVHNGVTYTISRTTQLIRGFAKLIAASSLTAASTIVVMDTTTAGASAKVDALVVVGLDANVGAYEDDMHQIRTDVDFNPSEDFESEGTVSKVYPSEGNGSGRSLTIASRNRAQLDIHTKQTAPWGEFFSEGKSYLDSNKNYGTTRVDFIGTERTLDHEYTYEKQATIYWEQTEPLNLSVAVGTTPTRVAVLTFVPVETKPAVIGNFATWSGITQVTV